jgi:hypothetical protein
MLQKEVWGEAHAHQSHGRVQGHSRHKELQRKKGPPTGRKRKHRKEERRRREERPTGGCSGWPKGQQGVEGLAYYSPFLPTGFFFFFTTSSSLFFLFFLLDAGAGASFRSSASSLLSFPLLDFCLALFALAEHRKSAK